MLTRGMASSLMCVTFLLVVPVRVLLHVFFSISVFSNHALCSHCKVLEAC
jgi:hypothetical protein